MRARGPTRAKDENTDRRKRKRRRIRQERRCNDGKVYGARDDLRDDS